MLKFTDEHEWLKLDGDIATVGITEYATVQLGDLVFVQLPEVGTTVTKGGEAAVVESVKAASDVFAPLDGEVVAINETVASDPAVVTSDPMNAGWLFKLKLADVKALDALMDEAAYKNFTGGKEDA